MSKRWIWLILSVTILLFALIILSAASRRNWDMPAELRPFEEHARSEGVSAVETGTYKFGWFMVESLRFEISAQQIAHLAKENLTKTRGWDLTFPQAKGYGFIAYKNDPKTSNPLCVVQYYDEPEGGRLTAYNPQVFAPRWRAFVAMRKQNFELLFAKKVP